MTYLERLRALKSEKALPPRADETDKTPTGVGSVGFVSQGGTPFAEISHPFGRAFEVLESGCPDLIPVARWQAAVEDGRRFLARWGEQADAFGWTARDLFGLHTSPAKPHPSYTRLRRYDETGLIWLLQGREVMALTEATAAIQNPTGATTVYRRARRQFGRLQ
jgi:hypothetical protein